LEYIRGEKWDDADAILSMRKAAFHNFRAADHLALQSGYTAEQDAQLKAIWKQIAGVDAELMAEMSVARGKMEAELIRLSKVKATLGRFRSGEPTEAKLEKPV
jgi:hypothetical protein